MPRLETFDIDITTGARGRPGVATYTINGFTLEFDEEEGGTGPGETLKASASPDSFPHSLVLDGPKDGAWGIEAIELRFYPSGEEPYSVRLGGVTLDSRSDLNLWYDRPPRTLAV